MSKCQNKFPECDSCVNREFDPFQCEVCEDASNYESVEDEEFLTIQDLKDLLAE